MSAKVTTLVEDLLHDPAIRSRFLPDPLTRRHGSSDWLRESILAIIAATTAEADARVVALEEALERIRDHEPEAFPEPAAHPQDCSECAQYRNHPVMMGACDEAHRIKRRYRESLERAEHAEQHDMRRIAREALADPPASVEHAEMRDGRPATAEAEVPGT